MSGPGGDGRNPLQHADGQRVGFVLARSRDIPMHEQFSAEELRQVMEAVLYAIGSRRDPTATRWYALAHRLRTAAVALREGRKPEPGGRCYACGRRV